MARETLKVRTRTADEKRDVAQERDKKKPSSRAMRARVDRGERPFAKRGTGGGVASTTEVVTETPATPVRAPKERPPRRAETRPPRKEEARPRLKKKTEGSETSRSKPRAAEGTRDYVASKRRGESPPRSLQNTTTRDGDNSDLPRLSKLMSERGLCSRREADEWIVNGWVRVNGEIVSTLGTRIDPQSTIEIDRDAKREQAESVTILLNKPVGYVSGQAEDGYEPAIVLIKPEHRWEQDEPLKRFKRSHLSGLAPAGRLDIDSTGLLVLTQDGRIAKRLIGDDSEVEKEYIVSVEGELVPHGIKKLTHGLRLDGVALKPAHVSWQNETTLRFVLREGRKRQIRRMCELVGLKVTALRRIRIGSVSLAKLPIGKWRYLKKQERF